MPLKRPPYLAQYLSDSVIAPLTTILAIRPSRKIID